jgi:methionine-rich copper-binding protein CopC
MLYLKGGDSKMRTVFTRLSAVMALTFLFIGPASAHTSVVTTTPIYKSTLTEMPAQVSIEFTDELMTLGDKSVNSIEIEAPDKSAVEISKIDIDKNLMTASLSEQNYMDGTYQISYRVVSADGHSVSGSYEIYLNAPTTISDQSVTDETHQSFFHMHETHIYWTGAALIVIFLWFIYRRFEQDQS